MGFLSNISYRGKATRTAILLATACALPAISGCATIKSHQGYIMDESLTSAIQVGVDNKQSVIQTLGRPTFMGQFDDDDWYYISRDMKQVAFGNPVPRDQRVMRVRFDSAGNVSAIENSGAELVARISPDGDKTPTRGRDRSFFEDLFGNIGSVGAPGTGPVGGNQPGR